MHEYPITQEIIRISEEYAVKNNSKSVTGINLLVGDFSGYLADSIKLYFDLISENTMCQNAVLNIENVKPKLKCEGCGEFFTRKPFDFTCPKCKAQGRPTEIGREFYIKSIEIDV